VITWHYFGGTFDHNTIQYNTKFVKRHVAVASEALLCSIVFWQVWPVMPHNSEPLCFWGSNKLIYVALDHHHAREVNLTGLLSVEFIEVGLDPLL